MDVISAALARVVRRQDAIDKRLERIEQALGLTPSVEPAEAPPMPMRPPVAEPLLEHSVIEQPPPHVESPPVEPTVEPASTLRASQPAGLETTMGLTWLNRIGAFTLVLALAFFYKLAVENQWIGASGRVILGCIAGLSALALADLFWRRGHTLYSHGICGLGIAILYLSFYAAFWFYKLVPLWTAFLLMFLCTAAAAGLALRYGAAAIAFLGLLSGYATPLLLSTGVDRPWTLFAYLTLLNIGAAALFEEKRWRSVLLLALCGSCIVFGLWAGDQWDPSKRAPATSFILLSYAIFTYTAFAPVWLAAQVLAPVITAMLWYRLPAGAAALGVALAIAGMVVADLRGHKLGYPAVFAGWAFSLNVWSPPPRDASVGAFLSYLTAQFLVLFSWFPWRVSFRRVALGRPELVALALLPTLYFAHTHRLTLHDGFLAFALGILFGGFALQLLRENADQVTRDLAAGVGLAFLTLAIPLQFTGVRITMLWMIEAAALCWVGQRMGSLRLSWAALAVAAIGLVRLSGWDAQMYVDPHSYVTVANARFLTFVVSAVALWWIGYVMRQMNAGGASYIAGHVVLLAGLTLEAFGWAARKGEDVSALQTTSITVLWAAYAAMLIATGVLARVRIHRVLGLMLMGIVVLKLYFIDVWALERIYRVAAFALLGVVLLLSSFLYSRYRSTIGNLLGR